MQYVYSIRENYKRTELLITDHIVTREVQS